ncbi:FHA domain-containing protein [Cohnella silvisoli]|uniref:FHA domain-containing protein n=1 Tax=Cohnella silvisoli TaxID=2873699 RepID=A0ABV1KNU2_9BACL|nr:FHA domain-containing protein [Cohnella silvisoli]MCD9020546.1 FHA domain-containing protein [Cohnella silvisoli]
MTKLARVKKGRRDRFKCIGGIVPRSVKKIIGSVAVLYGAGVSVMPLHTFAAGSLETSASQVKVGTLPLLAALGVGIAVAVGAVIAFLQMTAKGKELNEHSAAAAEDNEPYEDMLNEEWHDEDTKPNSEYEDNPLTDYTIPVTRLLTHPDRAEAAVEGEPRLCGVEGEHAGSCYRILNRRLSFGRDPVQCAILFPHEAGEISRMHCTLRFIEDKRLFILEDHGSSNGTFLATGERLQPGIHYELRAGEQFSLSGNKHLFEVRDEDLLT